MATVTEQPRARGLLRWEPIPAECPMLRPWALAHLPDSNDRVDDQDQQNDERLHESLESLLAILEEGKYESCRKHTTRRSNRSEGALTGQRARRRAAVTYRLRATGRQGATLQAGALQSVAAPSRILTSKSSNCWSTSCHHEIRARKERSVEDNEGKRRLACSPLHLVHAHVVSECIAST